jgi:SnoaL-like domain
MSTEQTMTTQQVAERLVELCRNNQTGQAQQELWADDVACISPDMAGGPAVTTTGKEANLEREHKFLEMIEEVHSSVISDPVVAGNVFAISWSFDATLKGQPRRTMDEVVVYHVNNGKITQEQYIF